MLDFNAARDVKNVTGMVEWYFLKRFHRMVFPQSTYLYYIRCLILNHKNVERWNKNQFTDLHKHNTFAWTKFAVSAVLALNRDFKRNVLFKSQFHETRSKNGNKLVSFVVDLGRRAILAGFVCAVCLTITRTVICALCMCLLCLEEKLDYSAKCVR